jgi:hypothetical protein
VLWGFAGGHTDLSEITCPRWRRSKHDDLVVHESKALSPDCITEIDGIPVTTPALTLLMLGAVCSPLVVERSLDIGIRRGIVTDESVRDLLRRTGRQGRDGVGVLRSIMRSRDPERAPSESEMELLLLKILRANGLPDPVPQHSIFDGRRFVARVDFAYVDAKIAIEYESFQEHANRLGLERDNPRRNALLAVDWRPMGATYADIRAGGSSLCAEIRRSVHGDLSLLASRRRT